MKKFFSLMICLIIVCSFVSCRDAAKFEETQDKTIVAEDGTEYSFVGFEGYFGCLGQWEFIGHVKGEKEEFIHLGEAIQAGMYSVNGKTDILGRYYPNNEFSAIYIKSDLLETEISLDHCIRFEFISHALYDNAETTLSNKGITDCEQFLAEIRAGQTAKDAGLYDLVRRPDGMLENCYLYGYACAVIQDGINIFIPLEIHSFDDKAYSIRIDDVEYVLPEEWLNKLIAG